MDPIFFSPVVGTIHELPLRLGIKKICHKRQISQLVLKKEAFTIRNIYREVKEFYAGCYYLNQVSGVKRIPFYALLRAEGIYSIIPVAIMAALVLAFAAFIFTFTLPVDKVGTENNVGALG